MNEKRKTGKSASPRAGAGGPMDVSLIEQLVKLMAANDLSTVDVRDGERRIMLRRGAEPSAAPQYLPHYPPPAVSPVSAGPSATAASSLSPEVSAAEEDAKLLRVKSPMVGTFYAAPSKGAKPFVAVGVRVEEDTDVCIIEAMKVFNNIKAECRGTIARILVQDSQPVEFGQALFLVKPD